MTTTDPTCPVTYRFITHMTPGFPTGTWCPWSGVGVAAPEDRARPGNRRCPAQCPTSDVEVNPTPPDDDDNENDQHVRGGGDVCAVCSAVWPCEEAEDDEACERCHTVGEVDAVCGLCPACEAHNAGRVVL